MLNTMKRGAPCTKADSQQLKHYLYAKLFIYLKLTGNLPKLIGNLLELTGNLLKLIGNLLKLIGNLLETYWKLIGT